jgi:outer membrane lipoprotein-sorting protein
MNIRTIVFLFGTIACVATSSSARAETLDAVLARMDRAAAAFQDMTANLTQINRVEVINETEKLEAQVKLRRTKAGLLGRVDFEGTNRRVVSVEHRKVRVFYPKSNLVELYDVGKYGSQLDHFLLLGFGTSGKELLKNYKVRLVGTENIGGRATTRLELIPKSKQALEIFKQADLWYAQDAGYAIQEKIHKNEQDYTLITYSDVKLNPGLTDKDLELVLPPGVKQVAPQK